MNPPKELNLKNTKDANKTWQKFKQSWKIYEIATGIDKKDPTVRLATFLHVAGEDAVDKYNGFVFNSEEDSKNLDIVIEKFNNDCISTINIMAERHGFYSRKQREDETYDQYVTQLRILSSTCEFLSPDEMLRDQFILNIRCNKTKESLINEAQGDHRKLTFDKAISIAKAANIAKLTCRHESNFDIIESMDINKFENKNKVKMIKKCKFCGRDHEVKKCPAYGKKCSKCNKLNHFAVVCKSKQNINNVNINDTNTENSTIYEDTIESETEII